MFLTDDKSRVAHLLRRAGLGASKAEVEQYSALGWKGAVDALINYDSAQENYDGLADEMTDKKGQLRPQGVQLWWVYRMMTTKRPLQERMSLFWHNHFATSASKVGAGRLMMAQNELFRKMALGNFNDILLEVSKDPAMVLWLDNNTNVKGHPNENYAREVMELFTLGIGNYTEKDVQEAARAFTGWTIRRDAPQAGGKKYAGAEFLFRPAQHDTGSKTVLGQTGDFDGGDIVNMLARHPVTARRLCKKLWEFFAYSDPEPRVLDALVATYFESQLSIKEVVRRILTSNSFYSEKAYRTQYKSPVDFSISILRALDAGDKIPNLVPEIKPADSGEAMTMSFDDLPPQQKRALAVIRLITQCMKRMGQELLYPPTVKGWDGGPTWVNSATMIERIKFADNLFVPGSLGRGVGNKQQPVIRPQNTPYGGRSLFTAEDVLGDKKYDRPEDVAHRLLGLLDAELPASKVKALSAVITKAGGMSALSDPVVATQIIGQMTKLTFATPEFQFC